MAALVFKETGLLPHLNPGLMTAADLAKLRRVSVSMGIMLETTAARLGERGGPHFGAPDKEPAARLAGNPRSHPRLKRPSSIPYHGRSAYAIAPAAAHPTTTRSMARLCARELLG